MAAAHRAIVAMMARPPIHSSFLDQRFRTCCSIVKACPSWYRTPLYIYPASFSFVSPLYPGYRTVVSIPPACTRCYIHSIIARLGTRTQYIITPVHRRILLSVKKLRQTPRKKYYLSWRWNSAVLEDTVNNTEELVEYPGCGSPDNLTLVMREIGGYYVTVEDICFFTNICLVQQISREPC